MPIYLSQKVNEGSTCLLEFQLTDTSGAAISKSNITTAILRLWNQFDGNLISTASSILDSFNATGYCSHFLTGTQNAIISEEFPSHEMHIADVSVSINTVRGVMKLNESFLIQVVNLRYIT